MQKAGALAVWRMLGLSLAASLIVALPCGRIQAAAIQAVKAAPAREFLDSLGIVTHMAYNDGAYASAPEAIEDLAYLGIHQVREGVPDPHGGPPDRNYAASLHALLDAGNTFDFITAIGHQTLAVFQGQVDAIARQYPNAVIAIEGPNEINNFPIRYGGLTGDDAGNAFQRELYATVQADPVLHDIPVYYLTGNRPVDLGVVPKLADYASAHPYPYRGQPPGPRIATEFRRNFTMRPPYPKVITETGYFNQPSAPGGSGVDDATQAKLTLDLLLDAFRQGVAKTFLYQLRSAYPDPRHNNPDTEYGLFNLDNSPKPAATAIHNLTAILADPGMAASFLETASLGYAVSGQPETGQDLLLQKSDGGFALVLWAEPTIWNDASHRPIAVPDHAVTLSLAAPARIIRFFDPLLSALPSKTATDAKSITVAISDHPVILELTP